ncbi:MAG: DUF4373 domain-containing protein [Candidatus Azobacteroides sp.]|nr:DUF4373 domain-containing protein [Candidatus Azobacteroides sp.]
MANNYFSHDSNARNDEKIIAVRLKYGMEGYGVYFAVLERMRDIDNYIHVKDYNIIAFDLRVSNSLVKSIIEDFGLFEFTEDGKRFYSESFLQRMKQKDEKSSKARNSASKRWNAMRTHENNDANALRTHENNDALKGKKSKVNNKPPNPLKKGGGSKQMKKDDSLNAEARKVFEEHYRNVFSEDYYWTAKDAGNMTKLLNALKYRLTKKGLPDDTGDVVNALQSFLESVSDKWILDNYSVPVIFSKFNEIIAQAKEKNYEQQRDNIYMP